MRAHRAARRGDGAPAPAQRDAHWSLGHADWARARRWHPVAATRDATRPPKRLLPARARIHLVIGPVGAGKSTFALGLARDQGAVRLTLDQWMAELFSKDRPDSGVTEWYVERAARCVEQIWTTTRAMVDAGMTVILEIGLLQRSARERFYRRVEDAGAALTIHVLDAPREIRRERVIERNRNRGATLSMVVPAPIFELASDLWEPPDASECDGRDVQFIRTIA